MERGTRKEEADEGSRFVCFSYQEKTIELFRCARASEFGQPNLPRPTSRPPGNVPYLVDNIWEWLRPLGMPCRRQAVFASPTMALAQEGAIQWGGGDFKVGRVRFLGRYNVAQCLQRDAKLSPDVRRVPATLLEHLGAEWLGSPASERGPAGALFQPVLSCSDVQAVVDAYPGLAKRLRAATSFWTEARSAHDAASVLSPEGEVFFEAQDGYVLEALRL